MPFGWMDEFMRLGEVWGLGAWSLEFGDIVIKSRVIAVQVPSV